jgi:ComF family protein
MWRRLLDALAEALYPPRCVVRSCGAHGGWLCGSCIARVRPVPRGWCVRCGRPSLAGDDCASCAGRTRPYRRVITAGLYSGVLRDAVHALKYHGVRGVARPLGTLAASAAGGVEPGTLVVSVPPPGRRAARRGVDHARLLAEAVSAVLACPVAAGGLVRTRSTRSQVGLDPRRRRENVRGAFAVAAPVRGRPILLVDDVMTTGATAGACGAALLDAGASVVDVCTVARALVPGWPVGAACAGVAALDLPFARARDDHGG